MKNKSWVLLIGGLFAVCLGLSALLFLPGQTASGVQIWSEGELLYRLPLSVDTQLTVTASGGENTVTIRDGKVAVIAADCPDGYCMDRGWCSGGVQIVCLPNRLVIRFTGEQQIDGVSG